MRKAVQERTLAGRLSLVPAAIILLLPFHAFITTWIGSNTGHLDLIRIWKEILLVPIFITVAYLIIRSEKLRANFQSNLFRLIGLYLILTLALGAVALLAHRVNASALLYAWIVNLRFLLFFIICFGLAANNQFLRQYWPKLVLIPAFIVVCFGLIQLVLPLNFLAHFGYGPATIPAYQTVDQHLSLQRIQSTLRGANPLGAYLIIVISAALIVLRGWRRIIFVVPALAAMFFTYSRSAWLGLIATLALLILTRIRGHRLFREIVAGCVIVLLIVGFSIYALRSNETAQESLFHTSSSSVSSSSNSERAKALRQGLADVERQPLGEGPGTAGPASFRNSGHPVRIAEDYYLQIGQEIGWVGIFLFLMINFLVAKQLWRQRSDDLSLVLLVSFAGIAFINLVSHAWTDDTLALIWWGLAGVATACAKTDGTIVAERK